MRKLKERGRRGWNQLNQQWKVKADEDSRRRHNSPGLKNLYFDSYVYNNYNARQPWCKSSNSTWIFMTRMYKVQRGKLYGHLTKSSSSSHHIMGSICMMHQLYVFAKHRYSVCDLIFAVYKLAGASATKIMKCWTQQ